MPEMNEAFAQSLERQSWTHYSIGVVFIILRLYSRARRLGGVSHYQVDDYLQIFAAGLFTILVAVLNVITDSGGSNLYPPGLDLSTLSQADIDARVQGSKLVLVTEQAMLNLIYVLKACVLILYTRLTLGLSARRFVRWLAVYVAVGWTATQITMFAACRPFSGYWALPPPDPQCATYENYAILQAFFNISSDTLMLLVPLPLIVRMSVAWRQKVVLVFIFSLGVCVIVAALLTKIYNLTDPFSPRYMLWYVREASVAVYVSNLPLIWPLLREWFPLLRGLKTAGVLPTPHAAKKREREKRNKKKRQEGEPSASMDDSQAPNQMPPPPMGVGALSRRDTFKEFGRWLRPGDVELQKPPRVVFASTSRERMLGENRQNSEGSSQHGSSPVREEKRRRRRSTVSGAVVEEVSGGGDKEEEASSPRRNTMDIDLERGDFVWDQRSGKMGEGASMSDSKFSP
ncbi:ubid family decarboxylase [Colletotrichum musicola]|uniref:Ubid family decarboxylase n=1 Tax=Colletotrichum musicola TaxID=2175873 RepID=A0A8H6NDZ0_9PEZI|nr:ubid family decarboxylase [Colletotrichum musicola]